MEASTRFARALSTALAKQIKLGRRRDAQPSSACHFSTSGCRLSAIRYKHRDFPLTQRESSARAQGSMHMRVPSASKWRSQQLRIASANTDL